MSWLRPFIATRKVPDIPGSISSTRPIPCRDRHFLPDRHHRHHSRGAFTLLSEAVSSGKIDLAVAYATWGAIGIVGTALGGLLFFGERLKPIGWGGMMVMALAVVMLTTA